MQSKVQEDARKLFLWGHKCMNKTRLLSATIFGLSLGLCAVPSVQAAPLPQQDCHKMFLADKKAQNYAAFKEAKCQGGTSTASSETSTSETGPSAETPTARTKKHRSKVRSESEENVGTGTSVAQVSGIVFPASIASRFAKLSAGRARMETCVAQYRANKENGGNGQLKWIQKGGGYWPACNAHLKGGE